MLIENYSVTESTPLFSGMSVAVAEKQVEGNQRMKLATVYAKIMYATEESKMAARIRLNVPMHKSLFHALVKEHLDMNKGKDVEVIDKEINKML